VWRLPIRLALLSFGAAVIFYTLSSRLCPRVSPSDRSNVLLKSLEAVLNDVVSDFRRSENASTAESSSSERSEVDDNDLTYNRILAIQDSVKCFTEGTWSLELDQESSRSDGLNHSVMPKYLPNPSCYSRRIDNPAAELCTLLAAKNILLAGPETTFYLHSLWLHSLEEYESRLFHCSGLELCTFHHICEGQLDKNSTFMFDNGHGRLQRPPSYQDLISSNSSLLRYVLSTSLHISDNPKDAAYIQPVVDQATGIRVRNNYWEGHAKKADVIILNRGPLPAPTWTYNDLDSGGNWSFAGDLYLDKSTIYLNESNTFATRVINAALHSTLVSFFPSTIRSLSILRANPTLRHKILVWHGSWYLQPLCPVDYKLSKHNSLLMGEFSYPFLPHASVIDPWSLYYNAQGRTYSSLAWIYTLIPLMAVYMQNRLMRDILPHFGIVFLPLSHPAKPRSISRGKVDTYHERSPAKDCLTYPFYTTGAKAMETIFLGSLIRLAQQTI
jgi:hypothetical protein